MNLKNLDLPIYVINHANFIDFFVYDESARYCVGFYGIEDKQFYEVNGLDDDMRDIQSMLASNFQQAIKLSSTDQDRPFTILTLISAED